MGNLQGMTEATRENWFEIKTEGSAAEFAFSSNKTGCIYEDGRVWYNRYGLTLFKFANREDAYLFLFGADEKCLDHDYTYESSQYLGDRDSNPKIMEWCLKTKVSINEEEDGSAVYEAWQKKTHTAGQGVDNG